VQRDRYFCLFRSGAFGSVRHTRRIARISSFL
jgi:hypothetical protein